MLLAEPASDKSVLKDKVLRLYENASKVTLRDRQTDNRHAIFSINIPGRYLRCFTI